MGPSPISISYAAQSLGLSPAMTGGQDVARVLRDQMAQLARKRANKQSLSGSMPGQPMSPAVFDLFGGTTKQPGG